MRYSVEPCHPLGFWGRKTEQQLTDRQRGGVVAAKRFLEMNALAQLEGSIDQGAQTANKLFCGDDVTVAFLLDDLFASDELMRLMPPPLVAEIMADLWARHAAGTGLPATCTVVSERSLAAAAAALIGDDGLAAPPVARRYQGGVHIKAPVRARSYIGDTVPSCPLLAAVWQMWRLGRIDRGDEQIRWWGEQPSTAERSFTMLNTALMPVEAAVGAILETYDAETLASMGYLFHHSHW